LFNAFVIKAERFGIMKGNDISPLFAKQAFYIGIIVTCGVCGSVVGTIWAMALGKGVIAGIIIGVVLNEIYWLNKGHKVRGETDAPNLLVIAASLVNRGILGSNLLVGIVGLIVWLVRYLNKG